MDSGLDRGLDGGLDFGPDFGPNFGHSFGLAIITLARLFHLAMYALSVYGLAMSSSKLEDEQLSQILFH